jgi:RNA polymerase sigma factor (sigma-70 family)
MAEAVRVEGGVVASPAGLEAVYTLLHGRALHWAAAVTRDAEAAEDVVQEAFIRVFSKVRPLSQDRIELYLRRAVVNAAISWVRSEARRGARERRSASAAPTTEEPTIDGDTDLWLRVQRLPRRQFMVIALRYWMDLSEAETARIMGCRPGTVKSVSGHALGRLRSELNGA